MKTPLRTLALTLLALLPMPAPAGVAPGGLKLAVPAPQLGAQRYAGMGSSVAAEGGYLVVGIRLDGTFGPYAGLVRVYDVATGAQLFVLGGPDTASQGSFGDQVAISGSRVAVTVANFSAASAERVLVYDLSSATPTVPVARLNVTVPLESFDTPLTVAISGTRVVVGVPSAAVGVAGAGSAALYDLTSATPGAPILTLNNPIPSENADFGSAVAISGDRMAIGAPRDDTGAPNAGSVYVYNLSSATPGTPNLKLNNPGAAEDDYFGASVAIAGTRVVVGTPQDNTGAYNTGSAYVFDLATITPTVPVATLNNPSAGFYDRFGASVSISGPRVLVGVPDADEGGFSVGRAYVYDLGSATPALPLAALRPPGESRYGGFGITVAITGTRIAVGAPYDDTTGPGRGRVYGFDLTGGNPGMAAFALDDPGLSLGDNFGQAVAVSGTLMVVGAPYEGTGDDYAGSAYVYDLGSAMPTVPAFVLNNPKPRYYELFGSAVAISGRRVVIGAFRNRDGAPAAGSAYVYNLDSATPTVPSVKLNNPNPTANGYFGFSVAIAGSHVAVGATKDDTGARNAGRVYIYNLDGARPGKPMLRLDNPNPVRDDYFGWSVGISDMRVAVGTPRNDTGASNSGCVYVYDLSNATPRVPVETLTNPFPTESDFFGSSVAISGAGVIVGVPNNDKRASNAGSAYLFDLTGATPRLPAVTFRNPSPARNDNFGYSVAISGTRVVVGTYLDDTGAPDAGLAYLYDVSGTTPEAPIATLSKTTHGFEDRFGRSVAIDGKTIVVGTPNDDTTREDKGAVYVFEP